MNVIHLLRKPLSEGTVAANVLRHGTGALNIEATRIGYESGEVDFDRVQRQQHSDGAVTGAFGAASLIGKVIPTYKPTGRWPANLVLQHLDGCVQDGTETVPAWVCAEGCPVAGSFPLDGRSTKPTASGVSTRNKGASLTGMGGTDTNPSYFDAGSASRFFKQVKA